MNKTRLIICALSVSLIFFILTAMLLTYIGVSTGAAYESNKITAWFFNTFGMVKTMFVITLIICTIPFLSIGIYDAAVKRWKDIEGYYTVVGIGLIWFLIQANVIYIWDTKGNIEVLMFGLRTLISR